MISLILIFGSLCRSQRNIVQQCAKGKNGTCYKGRSNSEQLRCMEIHWYVGGPSWSCHGRFLIFRLICAVNDLNYRQSSFFSNTNEYVFSTWREVSRFCTFGLKLSRLLWMPRKCGIVCISMMNQRWGEEKLIVCNHARFATKSRPISFGTRYAGSLNFIIYTNK